MKTEQILILVMAELDRAAKLHPAWPDDLVHAAAMAIRLLQNINQ